MGPMRHWMNYDYWYVCRSLPCDPLRLWLTRELYRDLGDILFQATRLGEALRIGFQGACGRAHREVRGSMGPSADEAQARLGGAIGVIGALGRCCVIYELVDYFIADTTQYLPCHPPTPPMVRTHEQQVMRLARQRKLLRARDLAQLSLPTVTLSRLVQAGKLERVARGLYGLPGAAMSKTPFPCRSCGADFRGVVCLLSALRFHDIGTQAPFESWWPFRTTRPCHGLATPRSGSFACPTKRCRRRRGRRIEGWSSVPIFDAARTVVDCFRFRNKIGLDVALEALRDGWHKRRFTLDELWRHAGRHRMSTVMRPYIIEAITA